MCPAMLAPRLVQFEDVVVTKFLYKSHTPWTVALCFFLCTPAEVQPSVRWCACFSTCITGPIRLARYVWGTTMSSSHISEASSLDRNTASQKKEESDLKRTTQVIPRAQ